MYKNTHTHTYDPCNMAPIKEGSVQAGGDGKNDSTQKENLWVSILGEVQARGSNKLPSNKQVLVLGDNETGKTTLIAKLQGVEDPEKGSGLEYAYIDVRDEYREDHTRLGVWVLDGDPVHSHLLRFALSEETFPHTLVMFTVSMTTPWSMLDQLHKWASLLQDHIDKLLLSAEDVQNIKQKYAKRWQDYVEPGDELEQGLKRTSRNMEDDAADPLVLPAGLLSRNLGLDVVVIVTKTDYMTTLEKEYDYRDEHFDFMQQWIRKFCLHYGAALFYVSVKEDKNCDLLYKYLVHRVYNFPFRTPALVVEKDALFIPSGWDNEKKISILYENMQSMKPDDYYTDVIAKPPTRKPAARETEIQSENEQTFLARQQKLLQESVPSPGVRQDLPICSPAGVKKDRKVTSSPGAPGQLNSPKKIDGAKPNAPGTSEGVLANFFNSLLSKKTGGTGTPPASQMKTDKAAVRSDAAAELERLSRTKKASPETNNSSDC